MRVVAVTALPDEAELLATGEALPSAVHPSDHLMLCCDLVLLGTNIGDTANVTSNSTQQQQQQQQSLQLQQLNVRDRVAKGAGRAIRQPVTR